MTNSLQIHRLGPYGAAERQQHRRTLGFTGVSFATTEAKNRSNWVVSVQARSQPGSRLNHSLQTILGQMFYYFMLLAAADITHHGCKAFQYWNRSILQILALTQTMSDFAESEPRANKGAARDVHLQYSQHVLCPKPIRVFAWYTPNFFWMPIIVTRQATWELFFPQSKWSMPLHS